MRISLTLLFWLSLAMFALDPAILADLPQLYIYTHMCHGQNMGAGQAGPQSGFQTSWLYQPKLL